MGLAELAAGIERRTGSDGVHPTEASALTLYRTSAPSEPLCAVYEPSLCIVAQGAKVVLLGEEKYRYDPAHFLLVSVDLPIAGQVIKASKAAPYLGLRVALDPAMIAEFLAGGAKPEAGGPCRGLAVSPLDAPLLDAVCRLVDLLDHPRDLGALAPLLLKEITYRLLTGAQGARLRQIAADGGPAGRIAAAIRQLKDRYSQTLRVESLAREARMSASAFHQHFKNVTAMSPLQYQKRLRLQEARRLMLGEGLDAAAAAFRVGYESPSQFNREYRRHFGAPPRRDVAALQGGSAQT